jgi:proline iminopeptidase
MSESAYSLSTYPPFKEGHSQILGYSIYWRIFKGEKSKGRTILCLHGGPGLTHDYLLGFAKLSKLGQRVVFYDQLGCGRSENPKNITLFTIERAVEEVEAVRKKLRLGKVDLLGHSYGGLLAIAYALKYQNNLRSLISLSGLDDVPLAIEEMEKMRLKLPRETLDLMKKCESEGNYDNPEYQAALNVFYKKYFCRLNEWPKELVYSLEHTSKPVYLTMNGPTEFGIIGGIRYWNVSRELKRIRVPTLVTYGRYDEVSPRVAQSIHRGIKGSKFVEFSKSSHMAMWEEPEKVLSTTARFLEKLG